MDSKTARRFWAKVDRQHGCWIWLGAINDGGYGVFFTHGKPRMARAHRFAYEALFGPVPDGLDLDHLCRVRACVRPDHLEPVSRAENLARGVDVGVAGWHHFSKRGACKNGHPFNEENSYTNEHNARICRTCAREKVARYRARENNPRAYRSDRCKHGHLYDGANTHIQPNGERVCRACKRASVAAYRDRKKAATGL